MKVYCEAHIIDPESRESLVKSLASLGIVPVETGGSMFVSYDGNAATCCKIIELFEQSNRHTIVSLN